MAKYHSHEAQMTHAQMGKGNRTQAQLTGIKPSCKSFWNFKNIRLFSQIRYTFEFVAAEESSECGYDITIRTSAGVEFAGCQYPNPPFLISESHMAEIRFRITDSFRAPSTGFSLFYESTYVLHNDNNMK